MSERILLTVGLRGRPELEADLDVPPEMTPANLLRLMQLQANWPGGKYSVEAGVAGVRIEAEKPLHASKVRQGEKIIFYQPQGAAAAPPREAGWPLVVPRDSRPVTTTWQPPEEDTPSFRTRPRSGIDWSDSNVRRMTVLIAGITLIYLTLLIVWIVYSLKPKPSETQFPLPARQVCLLPDDPIFAEYLKPADAQTLLDSWWPAKTGGSPAPHRPPGNPA